MKLVEALAVTYAAVGQEISDAAMEIMARDLSAYPLEGVLHALSRCRKELRRVTLADILDRIPGGHPNAEEAWAIVARSLNDERVTVVWTDEMSRAFGVALNLQDDPVAARMAFKECYAKEVNQSRNNGTAPRWHVSLGHDPYGREAPILEAVKCGRLTADYAASLLPYRDQPSEQVKALLMKTPEQISGTVINRECLLQRN